MPSLNDLINLLDKISKTKYPQKIEEINYNGHGEFHWKFLEQDVLASEYTPRAPRQHECSHAAESKT